MSCITNDLCKKAIKMNLEADCKNRLYSGIAGGSIIINKDDIASYTKDAMQPNVITNIALKSGAKAYRWVNDTQNPFTGTNTALNVNDTFQNDFTHTLSGFILSNGSLTTKEVEAMANGKFVVIIENEFEGDVQGDYYHFQAYGFEKGLKASALTSTKYENNDAWSVELQESNTPSAGIFVLNKKANTSTSVAADATIDSSAYTITVSLKDSTDIVDAVFAEPISNSTSTFDYTFKAEYIDDAGVKQYATFTVQNEDNPADYTYEIVANTVVFTNTASTAPTTTSIVNESIWYDNTCAMLLELTKAE